MAQNINTLSQDVIAELGEMKAYIDRMRRGGTPGPHEPSSRFREKQVRIARTTTGLNCANYPPAPANTFVVELGSGEFDPSCALNTHTFTPYTPAELRYAHSLHDRHYKAGTVLIIVLIHDKWYIISGDKDCHVIRFKIITANPDNSTATVRIQSIPAGCVLADVPDQIETGVVVVCDALGCMLDEPPADLVDRAGWAHYQLPIVENACQPDPEYLVDQWEIVSLCCPDCTSVSQTASAGEPAAMITGSGPGPLPGQFLP